MRGEAEEAGVLDDVAETRGRYSVLTEAEQREAIRIFKVRAPPQGGVGSDGRSRARRNLYL